MALSIGELVGYIDLDQTGWDRGLNAAGKSLGNLQTTATRALTSVEQDAVKRLDQVAGHLGNAFDPTRALADVDRLVAEFARDVDRMEAEAGRGGEGIVDQLRRHLGEAEDVARGSGEDAGRGFSDGLGDGGTSRLGGIGEGFMSTLKGLGWAAAGAAIGKLISDGIGVALDLDAARAKLQARVGDPALVAEIGKAAGAVYGRGFTESLDEAAEAAQAVLSTGLVPKGDAAALEDLTVKVQAYAKAWGDDVADAVQYASTLVGSGLARDATHALDLITEASRRVPTALREDVLEAGDEYSQFFRALGFSGEQAFGLLVKAAEKGKYGIDKTGDAIKEFTLRATTMDAATKDAYQAIGLNAEKMSNALLKGGDTAQAAFRKIIDGLMSIKDPTEQANTAIALFGTPLEDLNKADIPAFLANLDKVGAGLGDVSGAAKATGDALENSALQKLQAFKNSLQQNVVEFLGGTVIPAISGLADKFDLSGIGEKIGPVVDQVKGFFSGLFGDIKQWIDNNQETIRGWSEKIQGAFESMSSVVSSVIDVIKSLWETFGDDILSILGTLVDTLLGVWNGLWTALKGVFDVFAGIFTGDWSRVWDGIKSIFSGVWEAVKSILSGALGVIQTQVSSAWDKVNSLTSTAWNAAKDAVSTAIDKVVDFMKRLPSRIIDALGNVGGLLFDSGKKIVQGLIDGIKSMIGAVADAISDIVNKIKDHLPFSPAKEGPLSGRGNPLYSGQSIARLLAEGIASGEGLVAGAVGRLAGAVSGVSVAVPVMAAPAPGLVKPMSGPSPAPAFGGGFGQAPPSGGVVVNMYNPVIREEADIARLGAEFAFQYRSRG